MSKLFCTFADCVPEVRRTALLLLVMVLLCSPAGLFANDEKTDASKSEIDRELIESLELEGNNSAEKPDHNEAKSKVESVIEGMRKARMKMENRATGSETQRLQQDVVKQLDELIRNFEQSAQSRSVSPSANSQPEQQPQQNEPELSQAAPKNGENSSNGNRQNDRPSDNSSERIDEAEDRDAELREREVLVKDVWGHLPPSVRHELLNIYKEEYLPKYDELVRRYYQALAEQSREDR